MQYDTQVLSVQGIIDTNISLQEGFLIPDDRSHEYIKSNSTAQTIKHMFQEHI